MMPLRRLMLPALAAIGIVGGVMFTFSHGQEKPQKPNQLSVPPSAPFDKTVSGTGIIEANSRNIEIGSYVSGIVAKVFVVEGDRVAKGAPLFQIDDRAVNAELLSAEKELAAAEAKLADARVALADEQDKLKRVESLKPGLSVSTDRRERQRYAVKRAQTQVNLATAEIDTARSRVEEVRVTQSRMTVTAPIDGRILKVRIQDGEFVDAKASADAPILMGNDTPLYLRVTVDENDTWRFTPDAKAVAALRSNKELKADLKLVRVEPYVQPKRNLNGDTTERVDTRVLEVVYEILPTKFPLYIGQQMDVFVDAGGRK